MRKHLQLRTCINLAHTFQVKEKKKRKRTIKASKSKTLSMRASTNKTLMHKAKRMAKRKIIKISIRVRYVLLQLWVFVRFLSELGVTF